MLINTDQSVSTPLLFRTSTARTAVPEMPGAYDPVAQVWTVERGGHRVPIVEAGDEALVEITTKTRVRQEVDDDEIAVEGSASPDRRAHPVELLTKTEVQQEGNDEEIAVQVLQAHRVPNRFLAELVTKTDVQQESDDDMRPVGLIELETKTAVQQEQDDDDFGRSLLELETKTYVEVEQDDEGATLL